MACYQSWLCVVLAATTVVTMTQARLLQSRRSFQISSRGSEEHARWKSLRPSTPTNLLQLRTVTGGDAEEDGEGAAVDDVSSQLENKTGGEGLVAATRIGSESEFETEPEEFVESVEDSTAALTDTEEDGGEEDDLKVVSGCDDATNDCEDADDHAASDAEVVSGCDDATVDCESVQDLGDNKRQGSALPQIDISSLEDDTVSEDGKVKSTQGHPMLGETNVDDAHPSQAFSDLEETFDSEDFAADDEVRRIRLDESHTRPVGSVSDSGSEPSMPQDQGKEGIDQTWDGEDVDIAASSGFSANTNPNDIQDLNLVSADSALTNEQAFNADAERDAHMLNEMGPHSFLQTWDVTNGEQNPRHDMKYWMREFDVAATKPSMPMTNSLDHSLLHATSEKDFIVHDANQKRSRIADHDDANQERSRIADHDDVVDVSWDDLESEANLLVEAQHEDEEEGDNEEKEEEEEREEKRRLLEKQKNEVVRRATETHFDTVARLQAKVAKEHAAELKKLKAAQKAQIKAGLAKAKAVQKAAEAAKAAKAGEAAMKKKTTATKEALKAADADERDLQFESDAASSYADAKKQDVAKTQKRKLEGTDHQQDLPKKSIATSRPAENKVSKVQAHAKTNDSPSDEKPLDATKDVHSGKDGVETERIVNDNVRMAAENERLRETLVERENDETKGRKLAEESANLFTENEKLKEKLRLRGSRVVTEVTDVKTKTLRTSIETSVVKVQNKGSEDVDRQRDLQIQSDEISSDAENEKTSKDVVKTQKRKLEGIDHQQDLPKKSVATSRPAEDKSSKVADADERDLQFESDAASSYADAKKKAKVEKTVADNANAQKAAAARANVEQAAMLKGNADMAAAAPAKAAQAAAEKSRSEKTTAENANAQKAVAEKASAPMPSANKANAEQAAADKYKADDSSAEKAKAEKTAAENAKAHKAAAVRANLERAAMVKGYAEMAAAEQAKAALAAAEKANSEKTAAENAGAQKAVAEKALAPKPAANKAVAEEAAADKVKADASSGEKAEAEKAKAEKTAAEYANAQKAAAMRANLERAAMVKGYAEMAAAEHTKAARAAAEKAKSKKTSAETADARNAVAKKASASMPAANKAAAEQAAADKAKADASSAEKAAAEKAKAEKTAAENANAQKAAAVRAKVEQAAMVKGNAEMAAAAARAAAEKAKSEKTAAENANAQTAVAKKASAPMPVADKAVAEQAFAIGSRVRCRDSGEEWQSGIVTSASPLEVRPEGWNSSHGWDDVVPEAKGTNY